MGELYEQKLSTERLAQAVAEHFSGYAAGIQFNDVDAPGVLEFMATKEGFLFQHGFVMEEWDKYFKEGMEHHQLDNVMGLFVRAFAQYKENTKFLSL